MGKTLTEPLLLLLVGLVAVQGAWWLRARRLGEKRSGALRGARPALALLTLSLWLVATPTCSRWIAAPLESDFVDYEGLEGSEIDAVVILSGGLASGYEVGEDLLGPSTAHRVERGVQAFLESDAEWLVMTGGGHRPGGSVGDVAEMMADQAERMGVSRERIVVERRSRNTRMHPAKVQGLDEIAAGDQLAVATSAWHLRRSVAAFEEHFDDVQAVPAEFYSVERPRLRDALLPSAASLRRTTQCVHEYVGRLWYRLRGPEGV